MDVPLTGWQNMLVTPSFMSGRAKMKHKSTPTANVSWLGAASISTWTFSSGDHPKVPVLTTLISPRPVVFVKRTTVVWFIVVRLRVRFYRLSGCTDADDNHNPLIMLFAPPKRYPCRDVVT